MNIIAILFLIALCCFSNVGSAVNLQDMTFLHYSRNNLFGRDNRRGHIIVDKRAIRNRTNVYDQSNRENYNVVSRQVRRTYHKIVHERDKKDTLRQFEIDFKFFLITQFPIVIRSIKNELIPVDSDVKRMLQILRTLHQIVNKLQNEERVIYSEYIEDLKENLLKLQRTPIHYKTKSSHFVKDIKNVKERGRMIQRNVILFQNIELVYAVLKGDQTAFHRVLDLMEKGDFYHEFFSLWSMLDQKVFKSGGNILHILARQQDSQFTVELLDRFEKHEIDVSSLLQEKNNKQFIPMQLAKNKEVKDFLTPEDITKTDLSSLYGSENSDSSAGPCGKVFATR